MRHFTFLRAFVAVALATARGRYFCSASVFDRNVSGFLAPS
jgi:hypothetical protein